MTTQSREYLIIDGHQTSMEFCPPLPKNHPRVRRVRPDDPPDEFTGIVEISSCWRRYVGTWAIDNGHFYLVNLRGKVRLEGKEPLLADWFTGHFCARKRKFLESEAPASDRKGEIPLIVFEEEIRFEIEGGLVVARRAVSVPNAVGGEIGEDDDDYGIG